MSNRERKKKSQRRSPQPDGVGGGAAGFTLFEVVVAMLILFIGLLAAAAATTFSLRVAGISRAATESKLHITSMLEQVETLRNTGQLTYGQIANTGEVDNTGAPSLFTGFSTGFIPVRDAPGSDGIFGTTDDAGASSTQFERRTVISLVPVDESEEEDEPDEGDVPPRLRRDLKRIAVTVRFTGSHGRMELTGVSYLNNDARENFVQ